MAEGRSNQAIARPARRHLARGREARDEHLREARPARDAGRPPPRARRARLPAPVARRTGAANRTAKTPGTPHSVGRGRCEAPRVASAPRPKGSEMSPLKHSNNIAARMGRWSASHWKTAVFGWLAFVVVAFARRHECRTKNDRPERHQRRPVARADHILKHAGFQPRPADRVRAHPEQDQHDQAIAAFRATIADVDRAVTPLRRRSRTSARRSIRPTPTRSPPTATRDRRVRHEGQRRRRDRRSIDAITAATAKPSRASSRPLRRRGRLASSGKALDNDVQQAARAGRASARSR